MAAINWERWARGAGVAFVVLTVAAFILGGEPPQVGDPAADVVAYYEEERGQILVASLLFAAALGFWIWFAGALANILRGLGEGRVGATIIAAVSVFAAVQLVSTALNAMLAHSIARDADEGVVQGLFDVTWGLDLVAAIPGAVFFVAASLGLGRTHLVPPWLGRAGLFVAALFVLRSTNLARNGFWSPTGEFLFVLIPLALLWILTTSILLFRTAPAAAAEPAGDASAPT